MEKDRPITEDSEMPEIDNDTEDAIKQFIRVKVLDYPEGAILDGTDALVLRIAKRF